MSLIPFLVLLALLTPWTVNQDQADVCLDSFDNFETIILDSPTSAARLQDGGVEVAWFPDSDCVALSYEGSLWVISLSDIDRRIKLVEIHELPISNLVTNAVDGTIAFTAGRENTIYILHDDTSLVTLIASGTEISGLAFSPDGKYLAVASNDVVEILAADARLQVWSLDDMQLVTESLVDASMILDLDFTADGRHLLVSATWDPEIEVSYWNIQPQLQMQWNTSFMSDNLASPYLPMAVQFGSMQDDFLIVVGFGRVEYANEFFEIVAEVWHPTDAKRIAMYQLSTESEVTDDGLRPTGLASFASRSAFGVSFSNGKIEFRQTVTGEVLSRIQNRDLVTGRMQANFDQSLLAIVGRDKQDLVIRVIDVNDISDLDIVAEIFVP